MIGDIAKYFRFSWQQIMWEISFANLMMLLTAIPKYKKKEEVKEEEDLSFLDE